MKTSATLLCLGVILGGCSRGPEEVPRIKPAPLPERIYKHPTHGFTIRVPDGWEVKDTGLREPIVVNLVRPKKGLDDLFLESFMVQVEPSKPGLTAQQYFEESLVERRLVKDFQLISTAGEVIGKAAPGTTAQGAGQTEALAAIARMDLGPFVVQVLSYTLVRGNKVYTLTAMATPDTFDEYKGIFRAIALAFEPE